MTDFSVMVKKSVQEEIAMQLTLPVQPIQPVMKLRTPATPTTEEAINVPLMQIVMMDSSVTVVKPVPTEPVTRAVTPALQALAVMKQLTAVIQ
ncbi:MAG: hypothetical protein H6765_01870 [Candidatus Peribacteria bacterium]|nr:MAG: hypothetical protein H6765_01870 [Candidatus Peribacteria bacterium]